MGINAIGNVDFLFFVVKTQKDEAMAGEMNFVLPVVEVENIAR